MNVQEKYQRLENTVRQYNPGANFELIRSAFEFAEEHHRGQNRKDGSPFVTHPIAVAQIVAEELHLDSESIISALLHDCIEDTDATYDDIAKRFSPTVADLVEGVSKLTRVHYTSKEEEQMENLRKMLMAMAKDIRVILIKIADRTHNMRTMEYQSTDKQRQKSLETMEIYAPIAHRLGMQRMKWELEDLSLKYLDPTAFNEITHSLEEKSKEYGSFMERIQKQIEGKLTEDHIPFRRVYGRMKHPYSIYRKMYAQSKTMDEVFDLFAFRVIVDTVADCYNVLGVIHDLYRPVLGRFKDYIGTPKPNGYQSLHTTVMGPDGVMFEVQIRTQEMHDIAEYGIAAHWKYKQGISGSANEQNYEWVRRLLENQENTDAEEFIHTLKVDTKLCCSVRTLWGIDTCVLNDQKTCAALSSLLIVINMKETHFTILLTVVCSHRCHDDSVFYGHSADGHWFKNMWIFGFHRKIISLFEILSEESITWADVKFLTNER